MGAEAKAKGVTIEGASLSGAIKILTIQYESSL